MLILLLAPLCCHAALPIDSLFLTMPIGTGDRLSTAERLNLLHTYGESDATAYNADDETNAKILFLSDSLLVVQVSEAATMQLCIVPNGDIALIKTTLKPSAYSRIKVYDDKWQLKKDVTPEFALQDFLKPVSEDSISTERQAQLRKMMSPLFVQADFAKDGTGDVLFAVNPAQMVKNDANLVKRLMLKPRRLTWAALVALSK